jgi:CRISPR type I-E-associated protein CasB/Cse2
LGETIHAISLRLSGGPISLPTGELAALRRLTADDFGCAPFWMLIGDHDLIGAGPARDDQEQRWAVILSAMAQLGGLHSRAISLGRALAEAKLSELRFLRLLRAHGATLHDTLQQCVHLLRSRQQLCDQADLAKLVLSDGRSDEDSVRRAIARGYYRRPPDAKKDEA